MGKEDLRVTKTKRNLYQGLLAMMQEKAFEEIKVSDICNIALTNRSTFYDHFNDKYELLDSLFKDLQDELRIKLNENNISSNTKEYYITIIDLLFEHIHKNIDTYSAILKKNNNSIVMDMIYETIIKDVKARIVDNEIGKDLKIPAEIVSTFYVSAIINTCVLYIKYPNKYKKEDIVNYLNILIPDKLI